MPLIRTHQLTKSYDVAGKKLCVLKGIDLEIDAGECVAVMGPSGSGKSTLMHLLGCLDQPSSGDYWLMDACIQSMDETALAHIRAHQIGFVFQAFNLIPQLSILENILLPFLYREKSKDIHEKGQAILERVGLSHRMHHLSKDLSGGEMQRAAIARALIVDPLIILADEPTGNLDADTGKTILQLLQELSIRGVTVVIVTHDPSVARYCRRTIRMRDGKIIE